MKTINLEDLILPKYRKAYLETKKDNYTFFIFSGGRGSGKSSFISLSLILDMIKNKVNFIVAKRYGNSIKKTVLPQMKWAINQLGLNIYFRENKSEMYLEYIPFGNKIIFVGADDPDKIKGLKDDKFPFARLWIDEITQFKTEDEIDSIKNSVIREELENLTYKIFYSYNPPKRKHNWVNKKFETVTIPKKYFVLKTSYLDNKYISKAFIEEAEHIKETNNMKYRWEYLGEPIGTGVVPFNNLVFEEITDKQIESFDNIRQGLDWGYGVDPAAFVRLHYDKTRKKIYIFGEIEEVKLSNSELSKRIISNNWNDCIIIADSSEPKSIDNLKREHGIKNIVGAKKGTGSVETGEKWLDELEAIIIDPKRCPNTAREFESIDYETDKDGNPKNRLVDKDNHTIDAVRYALENERVYKTNIKAMGR